MADSKSDQKDAPIETVKYFNADAGVVEATSLEDVVKKVEKIKAKDEKVGDGK